MVLGIALQRFWVVLGLAVLMYCAVALYMYLCQDRLLYHPRTYALAQARRQAQALGVQLWPSDGPDYYGLLDGVEMGTCRGTVLVFHGNAGSALDRDYYVTQLRACGLRTILCEYPGYGARAGAVGERSLVPDARAMVRAAQAQFGDPIFVLGESLGCAVAAAVCAGESPVAGCLLITPWDTLGRIARHHYWYLPVNWFVRDSYDSIAYLQGFGGSAAIVLAERDTLIPTQYGKRLFESLTCTKRLWQLPGVGHNDWMQAVDGSWWQAVLSFMNGERP